MVAILLMKYRSWNVLSSGHVLAAIQFHLTGFVGAAKVAGDCLVFLMNTSMNQLHLLYFESKTKEREEPFVKPMRSTDRMTESVATKLNISLDEETLTFVSTKHVFCLIAVS